MRTAGAPLLHHRPDWERPCLPAAHMPAVTLEFAINDKVDVPLNSPQRKAYEQLIRRLLALPGRPAVVLLHHYAWWMAGGDGLKGGLFYREPEGQHTALAHYYDLPSVSVRAAVWRLMLAGIDGFKVGAWRGPWPQRCFNLVLLAAISAANQAPACKPVQTGGLSHSQLRGLLVVPAGRQDGAARQREPGNWQGF